ncbi:OLC1v1007170C1 [Oldenlandia corymbosa var. corymbosa]|uniref:OLC1v1007170C1 n=1 Tax=Oldenlandia corymbosa var. corymbosa TaxID=529605 RepID=A0AAV1DL20_OLDCO|nr:OLC1v1007170C1 [Oldenlandia corymbosa var. corymbosa]
MPFPMKIQPVDFASPEEESESTRYEPVKPPVFKSRFKRLFERQFCSVLKTSAAPSPEKPTAIGGGEKDKDSCDEFEPSSVCLNKMVENFIYESNENNKQQRCGRHRCNCLKGSCTDSSDDEADSFNCFGDSFSNHSSGSDTIESLKSLVVCACVIERTILAETAKLVEKNKMGKGKDDFCRKVVTDGLVALGYDASICKSRWEKSSNVPAGEYEYVDVMLYGGDRMIIDVDFRSEFEIARSTKSYKSVLQMLPNIYVGKADRLQKIVSIVSEAARQSLKKKGMPVPPWRKAEYVKAKWLSPYARTTAKPTPVPSPVVSGSPSPGSFVSSGSDVKVEKEGSLDKIELKFGKEEKSFPDIKTGDNDEDKSSVVKVPETTKPKSSLAEVEIFSGSTSEI